MARVPKDPIRGRPGPDDEGYNVGYGKPPTATQFKPGQSGNPKGRPRGARNKRPALYEERLRDIILDEAYRDIRINDGPRQVSVPMAKAVVRSIAVNAVKGRIRAQQLFTDMLGETEKLNKTLHDEMLSAAIDYKREWEHELKRRQSLGVSLPDPVPHPDHIIIDARTGEVKICGPCTPEEKVKWDRLLARKRSFQEQLEELEIMRDDPACEYRTLVLDEIEHTKKILKMLERIN